MTKKDKEDIEDIVVDVIEDVLMPSLDLVATKTDLKGVEKRLDKVENRLGKIGTRLEQVDRKLDLFSDHEERIKNLESLKVAI